MTVLIVTPDRNTPGKKDYTGAFLPEANAFARKHVARGVSKIPIDISKSPAARRLQLLERVRSMPKASLECVAFFCHGLTRKLPQLGWDTKNVVELADEISAKASTETVRIVLYACSTANDVGPGGDGDFADSFRDALCETGTIWCQVDAHLHAGHTTMNPYVRRFEGRGSVTGGVGGAYIITPQSKRFRRWRQLLRTDYRFVFPFREAGEIAEDVSG